MWSVNEFCEPLDHEFENIEPLTNKLQGVKLDDNAGLKQHCEFQQLKSTDYLIYTPRGHCFVEFSDIGRQIDSTLQQIAEINESGDLSKPLKKTVTKNMRRAVTQEARNKYLDTCNLFNHAAQCVSDIPQELNNGCRFLVVYAPLSEHISSTKEEITRFLDYMKSSLETAIPDALFHRVEIITLDAFIDRYY